MSKALATRQGVQPTAFAHGAPLEDFMHVLGGLGTGAGGDPATRRLRGEGLPHKDGDPAPDSRRVYLAGDSGVRNETDEATSAPSLGDSEPSASSNFILSCRTRRVRKPTDKTTRASAASPVVVNKGMVDIPASCSGGTSSSLRTSMPNQDGKFCASSCSGSTEMRVIMASPALPPQVCGPHGGVSIKNLEFAWSPQYVIRKLMPAARASLNCSKYDESQLEWSRTTFRPACFNVVRMPVKTPAFSKKSVSTSNGRAVLMVKSLPGPYAWGLSRVFWAQPPRSQLL